MEDGQGEHELKNTDPQETESPTCNKRMGSKTLDISTVEIELTHYKSQLLYIIPQVDLVKMQYQEWEKMPIHLRKEIKDRFMSEIMRNLQPVRAKVKSLCMVCHLIRAYDQWTYMQDNEGACGSDKDLVKMNQFQENELYRTVTLLQEAMSRIHDRTIPLIPETGLFPRGRSASAAISYFEHQKAHTNALLAHMNKLSEATGRPNMPNLDLPSPATLCGSGDGIPPLLVDHRYRNRNQHLDYVAKRIAKRHHCRTASRSSSSSSSSSTSSRNSSPGISAIIDAVGDHDEQERIPPQPANVDLDEETKQLDVIDDTALLSNNNNI